MGTVWTDSADTYKLLISDSCRERRDHYISETDVIIGTLLQGGKPRSDI